VDHRIRCYHTPPDRDIVRETYLPAIRGRYYSSGFCADEHSGGGIGAPEGIPEINKSVYPAAGNLTEFEC
jgi:hypothetical protein